MRTLVLLFAFSAICWAQDEDVPTSTARPSLPPPPQPHFNPMSQVFSIFQGLGQNFQQTFSAGQQQQLPGYLVNPAGKAAAGNPSVTPTAPAGGNLLLDLMSRAQMFNGSSLVTAFRDRVDRIADNNVVIMRLSNLLGQNRTRRQTEDAKPDEEAKPETKPEDSDPAEVPKPSETIDEVVKRVKDQKEQTAAAAPPAAGPGTSVVTTAVGTVGQLPSDIFRGLDGLLGVGSMSGQGMTGFLDTVTRLIGKNGNVTVARAETHFGQMNAPETRGRSMWERFEERRIMHDERRREWSEKLRERMERRRNMRRGTDDTVIKPPADETAGKPDPTDPQQAQPVAVL